MNPLNHEVKEFYETYNYPRPSPYRLDRAKHETVHISSLATIGAENQNILCIGCGTVEGNMIASANPKSKIIGVDLSSNSLRISKSIKRNLKQKNLTLLNIDILDYEPPDKFDQIIAAGVLHHIKDVDQAMFKIHDMLKPISGTFAGMVYSDTRPKEIRALNGFFRNNGKTVEEVIDYFQENKSEWFNNHVLHKEEIADTWLHPYFMEYSDVSLRRVLESYFGAVKIISADDPSKLLFGCRRI